MSGVENANVRKCRTKFGREFPEMEVKDATVKQTGIDFGLMLAAAEASVFTGIRRAGGN